MSHSKSVALNSVGFGSSSLISNPARWQTSECCFWATLLWWYLVQFGTI